MTGVVNGYAVNSTALASWVKGATVAATLTATVFACDAIRVFAGQANPAVSATPTAAAIKTRLADASLAGESKGYLLSTSVLSGRATLVGSCTSLAYTLRTVLATAEADAGASGYALPASDIGEAAANATASIEATPVLIRPGRATFTAQATGAISGVQFGSFPVPQGVASSRAEASIQLSGEAFTRHDGYVEGVLGTATAQISATYLERQVSLSSTLTLVGAATLTRPGAALFYCGGSSLAAYGVRWWADAATSATASASVAGLRTKPAQAAADAHANRGSLVPWQHHMAASAPSASITATITPAMRWAGRALISATAVATDNPWAVSNVGLVNATGEASGTAAALQGYTAFVAATATATPNVRVIQIYPGEAAATGSGQFTQILLAQSNPSLVFASCLAEGAPAASAQLVGAAAATAQVTGTAAGGRSHDAEAEADGIATAEPIDHATDHKASVAESASGLGTASGNQNSLAAVNATAGMTATPILYAEQHRGEVAALAHGVLTAEGTARVDVDAPPSRSMIVPSELRGLIVPYENRVLRIPA